MSKIIAKLYSEICHLFDSLKINPFYIFFIIPWMRKTYNSHKTKVLTEKNLEVIHG